jgi:hypothetical protein
VLLTKFTEKSARQKIMHKLLVLVSSLLLTSIVTCDSQLPPKNSFGSKDEKLKAERLPDCKACGVFVNSFKTVREDQSFFSYLIATYFVVMWKFSLCIIQGLGEDGTWNAWRWRRSLGGEEAGKLQNKRAAAD